MTGFIDKDGIYNYNIIIEIPRFEWMKIRILLIKLSIT